jgi:RNA polymerase sigma factor (sigma-70 family)
MDPSPDDAVTRWFLEVQDGEPGAVQKLWEVYYERLARLALDHLRKHSSPNAHQDGEEVALSAFHTFCHAASEGRFPRLEDRHALWNLLIVITRRKAAALIKREGRQKRGGLWQPHDGLLEELPNLQPGPEDAAIAVDLYEALFARLKDDRLRTAVMLYMEGWTVPEVAESLGCSVSTIERWLSKARRIADEVWGPLDDDDDETS